MEIIKPAEIKSRFNIDLFDVFQQKKSVTLFDAEMVLASYGQQLPEASARM